MLSVIIPARNEIYLEKTIQNILDNAEGEIEVLVMLDGYIPDPQIIMNDSRVIFHHFPESIGQRQCINAGARLAKGKYIMKLDAHCAVDKGFDVKLAEDCEYDWTVIPRMYNLDVETFTPKKHKVTDYMYIGNRENGELRAEYYTGNEYRKWHRRSQLIDDTMCCMGPGFFMHKDRYWELGGMDENHGGWGQMGIELACKAWLSGGSLKVNKKTWFAHWFRGGGGPGFPYKISGKSVDNARKYSKDLWINDKWEMAKRKFLWLIEKFNPPTEFYNMKDPSSDKLKDIFSTLYFHAIKKGNYIKWRDCSILKMPSDLMLYHQAIYENKPDFIIETGTKYGGSALFLADMCELVGNGHVITIDIEDRQRPKHNRVTYIKGSSIDRAVIDKVKEMVSGKSVMVILDSSHVFRHVMWELHHYSKLVTLGQYLVVEDCYSKYGEPSEAMQARDWLLKRTRKFTLTHPEKRFLVGLSMGGWLLRK